jgi:hypothetical protein
MWLILGLINGAELALVLVLLILECTKKPEG